jgi:2-octaprenyl-6-methoxyphenol hydroxylase
MSGATVHPYDVAVIGAGPAGMALAALLAKHGVASARIALIDAKSLGQALTDPRSIALSYGSRLLLEEAGAWPLAATPIHQVHISRRGRFGRSMLDRADHDLPALGYVTRYGELVSALAKACERAGIATIRPAHVTAMLEDANGVALSLDDGRELRAAIAVQAEGGGVKGQEAGSLRRARQRDYQQSAVIARVAASAPIDHRAYERFTDEGPLALLPQDGADGLQYALVWCVRAENAAGLLALDDAAFLARLGDVFGGRLGRFTRTSSRASYPLGLNAEPNATSRTVAIGNAAQTLHPVAGQGLNLGLRDAAVLARLLSQHTTPEQLLAFEAARQADRKLTVGLTDAMARAFAGTGPAQTLLGLSLGALDVVKPARILLGELMMFGRR